MTIGAQLYTVRAFTQTEKDFEESIRKVGEAGYTCVQVSGIGDIPASKVRSICDKHGVRVVLTHTDPERVLSDTANVIADHKTLGADYIGIGSLPGRYSGDAAAIGKFAEDYLPAAKMIADAGMKFMYHNHHFEFGKYDGKLIIDRIADSFPKELLSFILDTYWVQAGGADPAYWLLKFSGRVDAIHFKDMAITRDAEGKSMQIMSPVLEGNLNWTAIFDACEKAGVKYAFIEQDDCYGADPFECLALSLKNLNRHGYK